MFAVSAAVVGEHLENVDLCRVVRGRPVLGWHEGRWQENHVTDLGSRPAATSIILVTTGGTRLACAGGQRIGVRGKVGVVWRRAEKVRLGMLLYVVTDGILAVERVTCVVQSTKPGEPWLTVKTNLGSLFVEGVLCQAS